MPSRLGDTGIGVVSENPAFKMNEGLEGGTYIALKGRVPVLIYGPITKGDLVLPWGNGAGISDNGGYQDGTPFAVSLVTDANVENDIRLIECVLL